MKILILGSKGNLAGEFLKLYKGEDVTGWDRDQVDIGHEAQVMDKISTLAPDVVINCAAYNAVDAAETDRATAESINGYGPGYIAKACKQIDAALVHYSSGQVFDGKSSSGYDESASPDPVNAYGRSKMLGERKLQEHSDKFYIIRTAWLFGQSGIGPDSAKASSGKKKSFIDLMLEKARAGELIQAVGDEFGTPTLTKDLAAATRALLEERKPFGIYHLVNSGQASRYDWAQEIFRIKNLPSEIKKVSAADFPPRPAPRPKYEILNNTKFIQLRPWQEALTEFLNI